MSDCFMSVDTALFAVPPFIRSPNDVIVEVLTPHDWQIVEVSARYTTAHLKKAATIAVNAYHEREGHEVPWMAMGRMFYHVQVSRRSHRDEPATRGIVRMSEDGAWAWEEEEEEEEEVTP